MSLPFPVSPMVLIISLPAGFYHDPCGEPAHSDFVLSKPEILRLTKKERGEKSRWVLWAELMKRVFSEDVSSCVNCGGRMELRAMVIRPPATIKVLTSLVGEGLGRDPPDFGLE